MAIEKNWSDASRQVGWLKEPFYLTQLVTMDSSATDARNSGQTHILSNSLAVGKVTSSSRYTGYDPNGTDGTQTVQGVLFAEVDLKAGDPTATAQHTPARIVVFGHGEASKVVDEDGTAIDQSGIDDLAKAGSGIGFVILD